MVPPGKYPCNRALISPTKLHSLPSERLSLLAGLAHGWISRPRHAKQVLLLEARQQPPGPTGSSPEASCMGDCYDDLPCVVNCKHSTSALCINACNHNNWHSPRTDLLFGDENGSGYEAPTVSCVDGTKLPTYAPCLC